MTRLIARLGLIVLAATSPPSSAAAQAITAIRAGRLVDVEKGQVRRDQLILVRGEHVESIRPGSAKVPTGARVIDLSRYTVLPGLIDCHTHLIGEVQTASVLLPLERSEAREALTGARNARANGPSDASSRCLRDRVDRRRGAGWCRTEFTEEQIRAAVEQAAEYGTSVAAHAHGAEGIKRAVRAGVRSIEHGSLPDDEGIRLMKDRGTWLVADIWNGDYTDSVGREQRWPADILRKNAETTETQRAGFRKAVSLGVKVAYGTDSGLYPHGLNAMQLPYMVKYGMTPMQAVQSATVSAAELINWKDSVGSITPGKYADIIAIEGDALADLGSFMKVAFVMKGGTVYKE